MAARVRDIVDAFLQLVLASDNAPQHSRRKS
jgi:hypothetical protein